MRTNTFGLGLLAAFCLLWALPAAAVQKGEEAPRFMVKSGEDQVLDSARLRGKVVVLFYEGRDQTDYNRALKRDLDRFYMDQPLELQRLVARVAVVDCSPATWITKTFWADGLKEASQKEGITVYGDWDGAMRQAYGLSQNGSSFLVLGPRGEILYLAPDTRRVGPPQMKLIHGIITQAVTQALAR